MAKAPDAQCLEYTTAYAELFFPGDTVSCDRCACLETYSRRQCRLTGEYLIPGYLIGCKCPLKIVNEYGEVENNVQKT